MTSLRIMDKILGTRIHSRDRFKIERKLIPITTQIELMSAFINRIRIRAKDKK
jgi:hypothetical protein